MSLAKWSIGFYLIVVLFIMANDRAETSDHLDSSAIVAAGDIGDLYAWTSADGRRLNLIMTIVGKQFSDHLQYVFHIDSGKHFTKTGSSTSIVCQFDSANATECWANDSIHVRGDANIAAGLSDEKHRFRVFAGLRDDPFFNNVKGTRAAFTVAATAFNENAKLDEAGCAEFDEATSQAIFDRWRHTENGPAENFLKAWNTAALVISVDLNVVNSGGKLLAVWAETYKMPVQSELQNKTHAHLPALGEPVDRMGRALIANMLIGPLDSNESRDKRKIKYNRSAAAEWSEFSVDMRRALGFYDGYDRICGNQWLAERKTQSSLRYEVLAKVLADDRIWINSNSSVCKQYLAVELTKFTNKSSWSNDCGGRTPNYNADAIFRSLLIRGTMDVVDDGVDRDDAVHSTSVFPFLVPPADDSKQ